MAEDIFEFSKFSKILDTTGGGDLEVVEALTFCRLQIREHGARFVIAGQTTIAEALEVGRYVHEARKEFDIEHGATGKKLPSEYVAWMDKTLEELPFSAKYAETLRLMYVREQKHNLRDEHHGGTLRGFMQALRQLDGASEMGAEELALRKREQDQQRKSQTSDEAREIEAVRQAKEKAEAEAEQLQKLKDAANQRARERQKERDQLKARLKTIEEAIEQEREKFSATVKSNAAKQIAAYQARYSIPDIPEIFQADPAEFQKLLRKTTDERQREALNLLTEAMRLVGRMMEYEPEEAASGFLRWHNRDRAKESVERYAEWLDRCREEMRTQTTPGRLRVLGDGQR